MIRKKLFTILTLTFVFVLLFGNMASAKWYGGNDETTKIGAMADIKVSSTRPYINAGYIFGWADANTTDATTWIQAGARYTYGYNAYRSYYEYNIASIGAYNLTEVSDHALGATKNYYVSYSGSGSTWRAFINSIMQTEVGPFPSMIVEVYGESVDSFNGMDFTFTNVKHWANTSSNWSLFNECSGSRSLAVSQLPSMAFTNDVGNHRK